MSSSRPSDLATSAQLFFRTILACRLHKSRSSAFCFFFQAKDGIRDYKVTGVQTCALPIFRMEVINQPSTPVPLRTVAGIIGFLFESFDSDAILVAGVVRWCQDHLNPQQTGNGLPGVLQH